MATSGTFNFALDIHEVIEEAWDLVGLEIKGGYDLKSTVRSLNLLLTEWVNKGINLWTVDQLTTSLSADDNTYTLDAKVVDLIDTVVRDSNNTDVSTTRISMAEYLAYPTKSTSGKPTQIALERNASGGHTLYTYPTADVSTYSLISWAIIYPEDAGKYTDNPAVPRRFLPALVNGLAYKLALKNPAQAMSDGQGNMTSVNGVSADRRAELKALYSETMAEAVMEDRERTSFLLVPFSFS
jgi:hypothetical protein